MKTVIYFLIVAIVLFMVLKHADQYGEKIQNQTQFKIQEMIDNN